MEQPKAQNSASCGCSCCSGQPERLTFGGKPWITGRIATKAGGVAQVSTILSVEDIFGAWKTRWGIGRMSYRIEPGLYCTGRPDGNSPVLVTANYKLTFDMLRKELSGLDAWIMVLDTKGINVWCAAGKGTFGTEEIINRIRVTGLSNIVTNRTIILPQLGAPGVSAHEVQKHTGFKVVYGPVRAADIKAFLDSGMKASAAMRTVKFTFTDRLVLTPMEIVGAIKPAAMVFGILFVLNSVGFGSYGFTDLCAYIGAVLAGCFLTPVLLPWIPGRVFAFKGALLGILWAAAVNLLGGFPEMPQYSWSRALAYMLLLPAISAYGAMNFTGCSTFTSPSGVNREMKKAIPLMLGAGALGILLLAAEGFIRIFD